MLCLIWISSGTISANLSAARLFQFLFIFQTPPINDGSDFSD